MTKYELQERLDEYDALFYAQRARMGKAVAMWRRATGKSYWPDLGELLEWLMG